MQKIIDPRHHAGHVTSTTRKLIRTKVKVQVLNLIITSTKQYRLTVQAIKKNILGRSFTVLSLVIILRFLKEAVVEASSSLPWTPIHLLLLLWRSKNQPPLIIQIQRWRMIITLNPHTQRRRKESLKTQP